MCSELQLSRANFCKCSRGENTIRCKSILDCNLCVGLPIQFCHRNLRWLVIINSIFGHFLIYCLRYKTLVVMASLISFPVLSYGAHSFFRFFRHSYPNYMGIFHLLTLTLLNGITGNFPSGGILQCSLTLSF